MLSTFVGVCADCTYVNIRTYVHVLFTSCVRIKYSMIMTRQQMRAMLPVSPVFFFKYTVELDVDSQKIKAAVVVVVVVAFEDFLCTLYSFGVSQRPGSR